MCFIKACCIWHLDFYTGLPVRNCWLISLTEKNVMIFHYVITKSHVFVFLYLSSWSVIELTSPFLEAMPVRNLQPNAFTYAAVVHAHCVAGNIEAAWQRLGDMRSANLPITSATLRPFLKAGTLAGPEVLKAIFEGMLQSGLPIDDAFRKGVMSVVGVEVTYGLLRRYNRIDD